MSSDSSLCKEIKEIKTKAINQGMKDTTCHKENKLGVPIYGFLQCKNKEIFSEILRQSICTPQNEILSVQATPENSHLEM